MKIKKLIESVEDTPYTKEEIEMDLKSLTNNFTKKEGSLKCGFEEEKISAVEILKKHYNIVEASGDDRNNDFWYVIEFAEPKTMEESVRVGYENFSFAVINPDGTFAGVPCKSYEEARELASQEEGRVIVDLVDHLDESVECKESNAFSDGTYTVIDAGSSWKIKDGNGNWLDVEFEDDKEAMEYIDELQKKESLKESMGKKLDNISELKVGDRLIHYAADFDGTVKEECEVTSVEDGEAMAKNLRDKSIRYLIDEDTKDLFYHIKESIDEAMSIHYSDNTIKHMLTILRKNLAEYSQLKEEFPEDAEYYQAEIDKCKEQIEELVEAVGGKVVDESLVESAEEEAPAGPEPGADTGIASMLIKAINDEWITIDYYNSVVATLEAEGFDDMIETIRDITKEEHLHVGQLQALLQTISPNTIDIANGEAEAEQQMKEKVTV